MASAYDPGTINGVVWFFTSLALIATCLRLFGRLSAQDKAGWDDLIIAVSIILDLAAGIALSIAIHAGTTTHIEDIPLPDRTHAVYTNLVATALGIINITIPKVAVVVLLVRLISPKRSTAIILITMSLIGVSWGVIIVIVTFKQCTPTEGIWDPVNHPPVCWSPDVLQDVAYTGGSFAAFLDFFYAIFPAFVFFKLQMTWQKKVGVSALMGFGVIAGSFGIVRTVQLSHLQDREDLTYGMAPILLWSDIESNMCILAACVPTLKPWWDKARNGLSTRSLRSRDKFSSLTDGNERELIQNPPNKYGSPLGSHPTDDSAYYIQKKREIFVNTEKRTTAEHNRTGSGFTAYGLQDV